MAGNATPDKGADKDDRSEIKQGPRPRDEYAGQLAAQHREKRDKTLIENMKSEGVENPVLVDTLNIDDNKAKDESVKPPDEIQQEELAPSPEDLGKKKEEKAAKQEKKPEKKAEPKKDEMVEIVVYGEKTMVAKAEVDEAGGVTIYQKQKAAEHQLNKANEILKQAQQTTAPAKDPAQTQGGKPAADSSDLTDDDFSSAVEAIQEGTKEEGVKALQTLLKKAGAKPDSNDANELVSQVYEKIEHDTAMKAFKAKYPHIVKDPKLVEMVVSRDRELRQNQDETRSYQDRYMAIGEEIDGWIKGMGGTPPVIDPSKPDDDPDKARKERKATTEPEPPTANKRQGVAPGGVENQPPARKTPRQTVQEMKAARGQ